MSDPQLPDTQPADGMENGGSRGTTFEQYGDYVRLLLDTTRDELLSVTVELRERVTDPLEAALGHAAEVHSAILERLESESGADWPNEPRELTRYREAATSDVSKYLLDTIRTIEAESAIGSIFLDRLQRLSQTVADAPDEIRVPDEPGAYLPRSDDSAFTRLHKSWIRVGRMLRARGDATSRERVLPLKQLLQAQVNQRTADALLPVHEEIQSSIAKLYAKLEREITEWSFGVLDLDHEFGLDDLVTLHADGPIPTSHGEAKGDSDRSPRADIERVIAAMERLVTRDTDAATDTTTQIEGVLSDLEATLLADLQVAGTPLARSAHRLQGRTGEQELEAWNNYRERWTRWHTQVSNRLDINHSVLALREKMAQLATQILSETRDAAIAPVRAAFGSAQVWLDSANGRLEDAFDAAAGNETGKLIETLETTDRDAGLELQRLFQDTRLREAQTALLGPGSSQWQELATAVSALPDDLPVHGHKHEQLSTVDPGRKPFTISLREIATSAIAPDWPSLLSEAAEPLKARITRVVASAEQLQTVIDYNLGAAIDELKEPSGQDADGETEEPKTPLEAARQLAADAFRRSGELIEELRDSLDEPWSEFARTFDSAVHADWQDLISQVKSDDVMSERWTGIRTQSLRSLERLKNGGLLLWQKGVSRARQRTNALRRLATRLLRRGRSAAGLLDTVEEDESTIADALRSAEGVHKTLPPVYRRLFSLSEVAEPSLLQGRGRDLVSVRQRFEKWNGGGGGIGSLVLTAPIGGGRTSFIEALQAKVFDECSLWLLTLEERVTTSGDLVEAISEVLGVPRGQRTWAGIEAHLNLREGSGTPAVFVIHNLEHAMLQTAGGTDILQQLLALMVRTDRSVFWLSTISADAWRYFEKVAPIPTAVVSSYQLAKIGRNEVEDIVLGRHQRSGMTLRFVAPKDPSPLLKRRLRNAQTTEREQEILQEIYFDGVFKNAGGGIALTLLYWLRSVEFEEDGDVVAVQPFKPISFAQLGRLDLPRQFSLKAFVLHNTLTAEELSRILRLPVERSALILESLLRLALIERTPAAAAPAVDCAKERFRLNRLVVFPVVERLRAARILY